MKLKKDLVMRQIANTWVVIPVGDTMVDFNGMLSLNETGAFLWERLEKDCDRNQLLDAMTAEYDVGYEEAASDVDAFLEKLRKAGCFDC